MSDRPDVTWNEWGPPTRVRIEQSAVWVFARAVKDDRPEYGTDEGPVPCPPTYTFVMAHGGAFPSLQPAGTRRPSLAEATADLASRPGLYLHGEQEFVYHRSPQVGDVLEGRQRTSKPFPKANARRPMEITLYQTEWRDLDGNPVVSEEITSLFLPEGQPTRPA
ncbi:MAG: N-terminal half of MaoC dehydratase [Acidimicrobiales bacterium]|nr:N-terminal half of MaoC dehydratase [Acidimicrobiales bacterium]